MVNFGWLNLLKTIALTKIWDIPGSGMNSIDCVRATPAFDILASASEDKLFQESQALDYNS